MKPLTLVQLAQAIEGGKSFQIFAIDAWHDWGLIEGIPIITIKEMLEDGRIRIRPEPFERWIVGSHAYLSYGVAREYCIEHGIHKSMITHVKEVISDG